MQICEFFLLTNFQLKRDIKNHPVYVLLRVHLIFKSICKSHPHIFPRPFRDRIFDHAVNLLHQVGTIVQNVANKSDRGRVDHDGKKLFDKIV